MEHVMKSILIVALITLTGCASGLTSDMAKMAMPQSALEADAVVARNATKKNAKQPTTWKRSRVVANTSRLMIGDETELPLKAMQVTAAIDGFRARIVIDSYFYNDRNRQLEGKFQLRLPDGASPYMLAFGASTVWQEQIDIEEAFIQQDLVRESGVDSDTVMKSRQGTWEKVREARVVPKEKASFAYKSIKRRRIDPALMEWAGAGVFATRVYPLFPKRLHRIVVGYDVDLTRIDDWYQLTLDLPTEVKDLAVDISIANIPDSTVRVVPKSDDRRSGQRTHVHYTNPQSREIVVQTKLPSPLVLADTHAETGQYFVTRYKPDLKAITNGGSGHAVFLLDTSLSSNPDHFNIWLKLLRETLEQNRGSIKQFAVQCFNIQQQWWKQKWTPNSPENVADLMKHLNTLALEGATDLHAALNESTSPSWTQPGDKWDTFILSDGAITWGSRQTQTLVENLKKFGRGALYAYSTGLTGSDSATLSQLAQGTGGAVFSIVNEDEVKAAATAHRNRPYLINGIAVAGAADVFIAGRPTVIYPGQELTILGRGMPTRNDMITLDLGGARPQAIAVKPVEAIKSELAIRAFGVVAVRQLESYPTSPDTADIARSYATHFRVPGRTCSLLMLETKQDYERFNIRPEDDARIVRGTPAIEAIQSADRLMKDEMFNPKTAFVRWLERMEAMPGLKFKIGADLRDAINAMPNDAFEVDAESLTAPWLTKNSLAAAYLEKLSDSNLHYDDVEDEANRRATADDTASALRAMSSLVERNPGDFALARDIGYAAMQWALPGQAYQIMRHVVESRPYEPQTYHAIALCLEQLGKIDLSVAYYELGMRGQWDRRFGDYQRIVMMDYVRLLRRINNGELKSSITAFTHRRLATLAEKLPWQEADLVVALAWSTDDTDVDLHVIEPSGERCFYDNTKTRIGGQLSRDATQGYGPEMYTLKKARNGRYRVQAKYYASDRNREGTRTRVYATIYERWGTPEETVTRSTVTLRKESETGNLFTLFGFGRGETVRRVADVKFGYGTSSNGRIGRGRKKASSGRPLFGDSWK